MKKPFNRVCCFVLSVLVVLSLVPVSVSADPISAGIMANAFAQAIAAYGASSGVAMTFDVTSTNGIGETMHELWKDFRNGTQDADDYETLAAALYPGLYYKALTVGTAAADVYTVGYNISSTYAEEFDNFYNWLLSGPLEMTKVDNQYYEFSSAQIGSSAIPVPVVTITVGDFSNQPLPYFNGSGMDPSLLSNYFLVGDGIQGSGRPAYYYAYQNNNSSAETYLFLIPNTGGTSAQYPWKVIVASDVQGTSVTCGWTRGTTSFTNVTNLTANTSDSTTGYYYNPSTQSANTTVIDTFQVPTFETIREGLDALAGDVVNPSSDSLGVKAYGNGIAEIPDTTDPNYEALGRSIPSDIPWDDSLFGDGTGTLSDAQAGSITAEADGVIARDGILDLAGTTTADPGGGGSDDDDPGDDPDDYVSLGLEDIFPFCIPFDIYSFLTALAAEPVAPHFSATLAFPAAVGGQQTIDIDFDSPTWNQLAQLLRLLELLAFIIGLALLTRSMFIRG